MDLQISAFLLFVLFTAGQSFSCYECSGSGNDACSDEKVSTCNTNYTMCMSTAVLQSGVIFKRKGCDMAKVCQSGSNNVGFVRASTECCDTDLCNTQHAPDPRTLTPNGKKCYSCDETSCSNILSCSGSEDGCITVTPKNLTGPSRNSGAQPKVQKGCVTKKMCDSFASHTNTREIISCCLGNLCNGAESVSQSFLFLCCSLLSFILLH